MKYSKAAAAVVGSAIALGVVGAAPAFADGGFTSPGDGAAKLMETKDKLAQRGLKVVGTKAGRLLGSSTQANPAPAANAPWVKAPVSSSPGAGPRNGSYRASTTSTSGVAPMLGGLPLGG